MTSRLLLTRLAETRAEKVGPQRDGFSRLVIPCDGSLILSDRDVRPTPLSWTKREVIYARFVAMWIMGGLLAAASAAAPRFSPLALLFDAIVLVSALPKLGLLHVVLTKRTASALRQWAGARAAPGPTPAWDPAAAAKSTCVSRVDFLDGLAIGGNVVQSPTGAKILYVWVPHGIVTEVVRDAVLAGMYQPGWRSGNDDGSCYVVKRFEPRAVDAEDMPWRRENASLQQMLFMVPGQGSAYTSADVEKFEAIVAGQSDS